MGLELEQDGMALGLGGEAASLGDGDGDEPGAGSSQGDGDEGSGLAGALGDGDGFGGSGGAGVDEGTGGLSESGGADSVGGMPSGDGGAGTGGVDGSGGVSESGGANGSGGSDGTGGGSMSLCPGDASVDFDLVGWATENGGTTGGQGGPTVFVNTGAQLNNALASKNPFMPLTIIVSGVITFQNTGADKIDVQGLRNVSIIGAVTGAELSGIGIRLVNSGNIVLRNLRIHHVSLGERDAISIHGPSDHVWVDHCELYSTFQGASGETYDGLLDAKNNVQYLTYSWNHFHDSWAPMLAGSNETDTTDRRLTMHHNWIENVNSSAPNFRAGSAHVFNNVYESVVSSAINTRLGACVRIENNVFAAVTNPWVSAFSAQLGGVDLSCNELDALSVFNYTAPEVREAPDCQATIPYSYESVLNTPESVMAIVKANAGVGKLAEPGRF